MRFTSLRLLIIQAALLVGGTSFAMELKVGDIAPTEIVLEGVLSTGEAILGPIHTSPEPHQSYTLLEFFETENTASKQNLFPLYEISLDTQEYVQTRLIAINREIADVKAFVSNNKEDIRFPVHFDNHQDALRAFGVTQVPTIFILKNEKEVIYKYSGAITSEVRKQILSAVGF